MDTKQPTFKGCPIEWVDKLDVDEVDNDAYQTYLQVLVNTMRTQGKEHYIINDKPDQPKEPNA